MNGQRGATARRRRRGVRLVLLLALAAVPTSAQEVSAELGDGGLVEGQYVLEDVPWATRVDHLFGAIVNWSKIDGWLRNQGLDPDSDAMQELKSLARAVDASHPFHPSPDETTAASGWEMEAASAARQAERDARYRALGVAFGGWLENRQDEGYPPEVFLDRLLAGVSVAAFSTESLEEIRSDVAREAAEFEAGVSEVMETVPQQLRAPDKEDLR